MPRLIIDIDIAEIRSNVHLSDVLLDTAHRIRTIDGRVGEGVVGDPRQPTPNGPGRYKQIGTWKTIYKQEGGA